MLRVVFFAATPSRTVPAKPLMNNSLIPDLPQITSCLEYAGPKSKFIAELRDALPRHRKREKHLKETAGVSRKSEVLSQLYRASPLSFKLGRQQCGSAGARSGRS